MSASRPITAAHIDLKGFPPLCERMLGILDLVAAAEYDAVVIEWEDMFPWHVDERFRVALFHRRRRSARCLSAVASGSGLSGCLAPSRA